MTQRSPFRYFKTLSFGRAHVGGGGIQYPPGASRPSTALMTLLTTLLFKSEGLHASALAPPPRRGGLPPWRLRRVEDLAMAHLAADLSLDALAEAAGLSPFHFARAFRAETGTPPHDWLLDRRIGRARELAGGTAMTVEEVGKAVGVAGAKGLFGAFKRAVGTTAQAWRNGR